MFPFDLSVAGLVVIAVVVLIVALCCAGAYQSGKNKKYDRKTTDVEAGYLMPRSASMADRIIRMLQNQRKSNAYTYRRHIRHADKYGVPVDERCR